MKNIDLSKIIKNKHHQHWIALNRTQKKVVAWEKDISSVIKAAKQAGESKPVVMFALADFRGLIS
jgi:hypothetical protein